MSAASRADRATDGPEPHGPEPHGPEPLVVHGDAVRAYDFGPGHPLTPRRFGPAIELMRAAGAGRFLEPQPATDEQLGRLHTAAYLDAVRSFSTEPDARPRAGIGSGDCPAFAGMHEASARVAGGSIAAVEAILAGETLHAFNPGGGLHHAMADRASGFCIYNDVALAVARARDAGHRVLYVDLDVHHGDGVQALFWDDPQVLTFSVHETGEALFPGSGFVEEAGGRGAEGTTVNIPLERFTGDESWLAAVESAVPALADAFGPTFLVSQHGCDSHALDPLAHLRLTTAAYARAVGMLDGLAHRAGVDGRWLATGGGGYDVYRVVPRSWTLVWLSQAHRRIPDTIDHGWQARWADEAARFGQAPPPTTFVDAPGTVAPEHRGVSDANRRIAERSLERALGALGGDR